MSWQLRGRARKKLAKVSYSVFVLGLAVLWYLPIFWLVSTSLKPSAVATQYPPEWVPDPWTLEDYVAVAGSVRGLSVLSAFWRSLVAAVGQALGVLLVATPAAYALARLRFRGRGVIFWTYVATLAFPPALFLVPNYLIVGWLGITDTLWAVILPGVGSAFGVFLLRQFMLGLPRELEDAAWVDGCSRLRFLVAIVLPLIKPALVTLGLTTFLNSWNNLLWPLLVLNDPAKMTLPVVLARLMGAYDTFIRDIGLIMAGSMIAIGPVLIIFILFRRLLIQGISLGSLGK